MNACCITRSVIDICFVLLLSSVLYAAEQQNSQNKWAEIQVVDKATQRGIPLVELETVNGLTFLTDNAGRAALQEPELLEREVFFHVRSHGYEIPRDGFGFAGARVQVSIHRPTKIEMQRKNIAERMCRLTGEGLYRDSELLGYKTAVARGEFSGNVAGQDSIQAVVLRDNVYWFWGDTSRMEYPLGLFRTAGATSKLDDLQQSDFTQGIAYRYFTDSKTQFTRAIMPLPERSNGVIWISGVTTVPNEQGVEKIVAHYSRREGLAKEIEQGIALFNEEKAIFEAVQQLPLTETWRKPHGHAILLEEVGKKWLLFGSPNPNVRVPATLQDCLNPAKYEAFTCLKAQSQEHEELNFNAEQQPQWRWQTQLPPVDSKQEQTLVKAGKLKEKWTRFYPANSANTKERICLHNGTVRWNAYRNCWVLLAGEIGGKSSFLGEVWYAEAKHANGPFTQAIKIVTHEQQTFYNVCHHAFLDSAQGRYLHFEGTYTNEFSGNSYKTPRYNYNQILYRLDLEHSEIQKVFTKR
jgi:hypothetical protein